MTEKGLTLVVPAFNEEKGIENVLNHLKAIAAQLPVPSEIIVVNDGSTDSTADILKRTEGLRVIDHNYNRGYGAAIKTGILEATYGLVAITDADGTYPNERIPDLLDSIETNDMVIGSRQGKGAKMPLVRKPAKWILSKIANYLARRRIPDLNSGLRIFRKEIPEKFFDILPDQFSFTTTITLAMVMRGYRIEFIPIDYHHRVGRSKIHPIYDTLNFIQLIIRTILYFDPLRIFLPVSLLLILAGIILFILRIAMGGGFGVSSILFITAGIQFIAIGMLADLIDRRTKS